MTGSATDRGPDTRSAAGDDGQAGAPDLGSGMSSEVKLFGRMAIFGIAVGVGYWLLTRETAGAVMLTAFGGASGLAAVAIFVGSRGRPTLRDPAADGPIGATLEAATEPLPRPGWAPLGIAIGLGGVALAGAFGPWIGITGGIVAIRGAKAWLDAAIRRRIRRGDGLAARPATTADAAARASFAGSGRRCRFRRLGLVDIVVGACPGRLARGASLLASLFRRLLVGHPVGLRLAPAGMCLADDHPAAGPRRLARRADRGAVNRLNVDLVA